MKHAIFALLGVAACLVQTTSYAAASSSASLNNITFTLVDLDTSDGIDPSLRFLGRTFLSAYATDNSSNGFQPIYLISDNPFDSLSDSNQTSRSSAFASSTGITADTITGAGSTLIGSMATNSHSDGIDGPSGSHSSMGYADVSWNGNNNGLYVSGKTKVIATATATASSMVTEPFMSNGTEFTQALANLFFIYGPNNDEFSGVAHIIRAGNAISGDTGLLIDPLQNSITGEVTASFENNADEVAFITFVASTLSQSFSSVSAVPEPETYAMMLLGLGALQMLRHQKRRLKSLS